MNRMNTMLIGAALLSTPLLAQDPLGVQAEPHDATQSLAVGNTFAAGGLDIRPLTDAAVGHTLGNLPSDAPQTAGIELEFGATLTADAAVLAEAALLGWQQGEHDLTEDILVDLQETHGLTGVGLDWSHTPPIALTTLPGDIPIVDRSGAVNLDLEHDPSTGNLFALVEWFDGWSLHLSADGGISWSETYRWLTPAGTFDVDLAIVDQYAYVTYVASAAGNEVRLRRCRTSDGGVDSVYGYRTVFTHTDTFGSVSLESNIDQNNNRLYLSAITRDNLLRWGYLGANGIGVTEDSPAINNAWYGLDSSWNQGFSEYFLYLSYWGSDDNVYVLRKRGSDPWESLLIDYGPTPFGAHITRISAHEDYVVCAFESTTNDVNAVYYRESYNAGDFWISGTIARQNGVNYLGVDVTARGGNGVAAVTSRENVAGDEIIFRERQAYSSTPWNRLVPITDSVVALRGAPLAINPLPPTDPLATTDYGVLYLDALNRPYFHRLDNCPGDVNGDRLVDLSDLSQVLADFGAWSGSPSGDVNNDGVVDLADLAEVLALFGNDCR